MENRIRFFRGGGGNKERDNLKAWLSKQKLSEDEIVNLLERELAQRKNIKLVKRCVKDLGLNVKGFMSNDVLELYFDVYKNDKSICYISKGWQDPGFRVGEFIEIDKVVPGFKEKFYEIFRICSKDLISVSVSEIRDKFVGMSLEIGIYRDGLNAKVLKNATETLEQVLKNISKILYNDFT